MALAQRRRSSMLIGPLVWRWDGGPRHGRIQIEQTSVQLTHGNTHTHPHTHIHTKSHRLSLALSSLSNSQSRGGNLLNHAVMRRGHIRSLVSFHAGDHCASCPTWPWLFHLPDTLVNLMSVFWVKVTRARFSYPHQITPDSFQALLDNYDLDEWQSPQTNTINLNLNQRDPWILNVSSNYCCCYSEWHLSGCPL